MANACTRSFAAGKLIATDTAHTFAGGLAVRVPEATALAVICVPESAAGLSAAAGQDSVWR